MTHVDTLIRYGFVVSTNLELASQLIHELETMLVAAARHEGESDGEGTNQNPHDVADDATLVAQARLRALADARDVHRSIERAVSTFDTADAAITVLPTTATVDEILEKLAEAGVSIGRLATYVQGCGPKLDGLERALTGVLRMPADGALTARVVTARARLDEATNNINFMAAEHKELVGQADSVDVRVQRQATLAKADAAHAKVETYDDLLGLCQQLYEQLGIVADRARLAEELLSGRQSSDTSHGFTWTASQWGQAVRHTSTARGEITAAIDEVSSAIAALEDVHDLDVSDAVQALANDAISLTSLVESLSHIKAELWAAWETVPAKKDGDTHSATVVDAAFDDAWCTAQSAHFVLEAYVTAHPMVVTAIDQAARR